MNCFVTTVYRSLGLKTEVSNLAGETDSPNSQCFKLELASWWVSKCVTMGKNRQVKEPEEGQDRTPPKSKVAELSPTKQAAATPQAPQHADMLGALNAISGILQGGFAALNNKVGEVNTNMVKLDDNMTKRLDDLEAVPDSGSEDEAVPVANGENPKKRKRQDDHELSDGEIVEPQSEVLAETLVVIETDSTLGPPVSAQMTDFVKKAFAKPLHEDVAKKLGANFATPKNIDCLRVPRVNEPIFIKIPTTVKNRDRAVQDNQATFVKVLTGLIKVADTLASHEKDDEWVKETVKVATGAITLAAGVQMEWMKARKEEIKPSLPDDFKRLSATEVPLTAHNLFGDDLEGSIKSVESTNKIAKRMETPKPKPANNNNNKSKWANKKKRRFNNNKNNNNKNNNNRGNNDDDYKKSNKDFRKRGSKN